MGKQTPFEKFRDSITPMGYVPSQSYAEDVASLQQSDYFLQNFKTPSDIQEYKNYILDTQFRQMGVQSPYESTGDYRARFNPEADINNTLLSGDDTPEQDLFKRISHQIILNRGKLPVASFLEQAVNSSMTAGWAKFLGDNMFDFKGEIPDLHMAEDGIFYKGKRLNLTQEQMNILNDYNAKISGTNKDYSFIEDIAKTATSLVFDAPLLFMTGGISAGAMKLSTVTSALAKSTQYLPRLTGQIIQQGINFNLLGIPQTVESTRQNGLSGMLGSVWHNVTTGSLAAFTGTTGVALGKATGLMFLKNNPAIREEFGGLLGSTGFGYSLGKIEGMSDEDAIAQGLAFAATHFTNPTAYKRVITEMKNRNVRVYAESLANNQDTGMLPDYFIEKDGKYQKIEADAFKREGRIVPMDVEPIEATSSNKMEYLPINSLPDYAQIKFRDALARDRNEKNGQKLYEKWVKDLDPEYVKANADKLRSLAEITSASLVGAKLGEVFGKWKLPADAKLDNQMIKLSKQYSLPYSDVKRFVLENVNEYFISPEDVISRIQENPTVAKDLEGVLKVAGETFVKQAKANYAQELLNKAGIPASRQLTEGTPLKPVDLKTEAERIAEGVRRTDLKKQAVEGVIPATEPKPDKYVFYDFNGELVPMVKNKGKLTIAGTNVEIPFETVKDKVKTKAEIRKEIKEKASAKKTKELEVNKTVEFEADGKKQTGVITTFTDEFKNANIRTEDGKVLNVPVSSLKETEGVKSGKEKTEVLKETQPSEMVAEAKPVEPVESVESKPIESTIETKPENKPEQTQVSTVKETTKPNTNIASTETKATNEPKKEFEFEKSNLLDVIDKVVSDNNYIISQDGKAKINKTISDIKDYARKMGVPEKDVRDFAILTLKEAGLPNAKIANMMKIGGSAISTDAVKKVVERKSNIYGKQAKELSTRRSAEEQPKTLFEEELASQMGKVNMGRKQEDLSGEDLSGKDVGLASLQQGEVVGEQPREITRVRPETRMKRAEDVVKKVLEKYDLEDRKQYEKALKEVSENRYLEEGGDTEVGIAMLQNKKLGRELRDPELLNPTLMFETTGKGTRLTPEQRQADIAKGNEFWNEFGVEVVAGQIPQEPGKPLRSGMFEFNFTDGTGKITIDTTLGRTTTMPHENMHGLMTLAYGKDRALVDRLLKEYGWNGNMKDKSFVDAQEKVITQIQQMPNRNPLVQRLVETWERFANWFQGKGFYSEAQLFRKLASGQIEVAKFKGDGNIKFYEAKKRKAFHGTDKLFDKFDLNYVGEGEGLAFYGWGINLTSDKSSAKGYADLVSSYTNNLKIGGRFLEEKYPAKVSELINEIIDSNIPRKLLSKEELIAELDKSREYFANDILLDKVIKDIKENGITGSDKYVYEVDINGNLLSYFDKIDSVNLEKINKSLLKDGIISTPYENIKAGHLYTKLTDYFRSAELASKYLYKLGIDGLEIKHSKDVYDYTMFNPDNVEIVKKDIKDIRFYETVEKPTDSKTDLLEITDSKEYAKFVEWRDKYLVQTSKVVPVDKVDYALKNNKLSTTAKKIGNKIYQMGIQVNNYVNQVDKNGDYIRPTERGLYLIARDKLVTKMPYEINSVLKNPETWNEGHHFRMLDNNNRKDWTNRNDIASKINQYHLDIYYGKKEAPKLMEGETLEQAHTRIGKDIGLTDAQIKADWKTQQAYAQAMNKAYNATVDMYANLKDDMTGDYIVVDGLSRKQLDKVFGTESIKDEVEAYSRAKEIINANPEKRFEVAVELANKSPFAERQNPFYHSDTRPSNPNFWLAKGKKPTGELKDGKIQWDEFFTYAENEKEANRIAKEWNDKGFAVEEKFNIGKEISDKRYNRLSANQLINLANAGHIPISNETVKALLEATKSGRFEQHSLEKKYVPGMHGTAKEYESQLVNFVNEAMSASVKRYALDEMKDYILKENIMLNQIMKNPATTDIEKTEAKGTSEWMSQFYNQVAQSDRSVVDTLREIATTYYIGFKPSFPFMQMFQPLQMALPEAIKEGGNTGLWAKSLGTAWDLAYEIRARQKGETTGKVEDELFALYDKFDKMNKMGATGIRELTGEAGDIQLHYGSNSYRNWKTFMKFGNMAGAIAEKYTRLQSLAMWYDIAKSKGLSGKAMEDFVLTKHDEVMALWGASGRPVIGQSKEMGTQQQKAIKAFAKSFFTFKTYTMANLGQYDRLMRNRSWGALGTKMAVGVGLHGITKFPLMATFYGLYNLLSDDDLEYEQLKALDEVNAGILGRGISDILPISLQNMFDERTAFVSDAYAETRSKSAEGKLLEAMLGAPYGVPKDMIEGSMAIHKLVMNGIDDDAVLTEDERIRAKKNWSKVLPLAARNVFNAMNMDTDGIQIRGRELVKAEDISWADVVYKVLGFNPSKVANAYELQFSGFPAKWSRINGKIAELKKIRKEIAEEKGYTQLERKTELQNVARLLKEAMSEQSELRKSTDYRSAVKQKLISP